MQQWTASEAQAKANEVLNQNVDRGLEALTLAGEVHRDLSGRTVDVSASIARESVQFLGEVQAAFRQALEEAREIWNRQYTLVQELPRDPMAVTQKAIALSVEGGERAVRLGDAQREAISRFSGNVQGLVDRAGRETQESLAKYADKILKIYGLKN